jgi:hypothetical protein
MIPSAIIILVRRTAEFIDFVHRANFFKTGGGKKRNVSETGSIPIFG